VILERIREEREHIRHERKVMIKDGLMLLAAAIVIIGFLLIWNGEMTGYASLETFETEYVVRGNSPTSSLSFELIPAFIATVGENTRFKVKANRDDVVFRDDSNLFEITQEGIVEFTASYDDVGKHNAWIIVKDNNGEYYYQNVKIIIEE